MAASRKIGLIGGGDLSRQLRLLLPPAKFVVFDDASPLPLAASLEKRYKDFEFYIALGYRHLKKRSEVIRFLKEAGRRVPAFIHPSCFVGKATVADGCFVYPRCNLDNGVILEEGVLLNNSVTLSHDTFVGECSYLSPSVTTSGFVHIGKYCFLGTGTVISDGITIGDGVKVGIGSVVTQDYSARISIIGNPAREISRDLEI